MLTEIYSQSDDVWNEALKNVPIERINMICKEPKITPTNLGRILLFLLSNSPIFNLFGFLSLTFQTN